MAKRTSYSPSFKAKVVLEALRGEHTVSELAAKYEIHPTLVTRWKRPASEGPSTRLKSKNSMPRSASSRWRRVFLERAFGR